MAPPHVGDGPGLLEDVGPLNLDREGAAPLLRYLSPTRLGDHRGRSCSESLSSRDAARPARTRRGPPRPNVRASPVRSEGRANAVGRRRRSPCRPDSLSTCATARQPGVPVMTSSDRFTMRHWWEGYAGPETMIIPCDVRVT